MERSTAPMRLVMAALAIGIFAGASSTRLLDTLLPQIAHDYRRSVASVGMAVTAYAASYSFCQLIFGPLGDRIGHLRLATIAMLLAGLTAFCCMLPSSLTGLVAARLASGAVTAGIAPMALAWVSHATSLDDRPVAMARLTGASIIGMTTGQVGGGLIGDWLGWQSCFLITGCLFLIAGGALILVNRWHPSLVTAGRRERNGPDKQVAGLVELLRRRSVRPVLASVGVEGFTLYMSLTYISVLIQARLGFGSAAIGLIIGCFGLGGIGFVLWAGPIVRRLDEAWRARLGGLLASFGFLAVLLSSSPIGIAFGLAMVGFGFTAMHNILQVRATHMAPDAAGSAVSLFAASFFLAQSIGAAFGSWAIGYIGIAALCGLSAAVLLVLGLVIGRTSPRRRPCAAA